MKRHSFPTKTLLEEGILPYEKLAELAMREGQSTNPLFRVHRWFARRLSVQFRSLLAALTLSPGEANHFWDKFYGDIDLSGCTVLDPFVGGGTSLIESAQCGASVVGYDIDPVASSIARFGLDIGHWDRLPLATEELVNAVSRRILPLHRTEVEPGREATVLHHFWVERRICHECELEFDLHPHHQLAYDVRKKRQWVFCGACGEVHELDIDRKQLRCDCGERTTIHSGPLVEGAVRCPKCRSVEELSARGRRTSKPPLWRLFAQEYIEGAGKKPTRHFKKATDKDRVIYARAASALNRLERNGHGLAPERAIPVEGRSDARPLIHGFTRYRELFNARQLLHLTILGRAVSEFEDPCERRLFGVAFSEHLTSNCMYAAYAFGYRRLSPLFSIHGYRHITRPVELNPWLDGIGRGTFPNALNKIRRAIQFSKSPSQLGLDSGRDWDAVRAADAAARSKGGGQKNGQTRSIRTGSSADLSALADGSVDLVLTDPPYFDNLSYSELSDFYLSWHQALGIADPPYDDPAISAPLRENLALSDRSEVSIETFAVTLTSIFRECRRVLSPDGVCVFTFHHTSSRAWEALGRAIASSGLRVSAVVPSRGEGQGGLHTQDGTIKWDAVLVCRKPCRSVSAPAPELLVIEADIARARKRVAAYACRLSKSPRTGFRSPDQLNLFRAILVSRAIHGTATRRGVPLLEALTRWDPLSTPRESKVGRCRS